MAEVLFLPERLKKVREEGGLNKAAAARLLGLSKMGYQRYESAARTPSYQMIIFMVQKLKTSADYLIGTVNDPSRDRLLAYNKRLKGLDKCLQNCLHLCLLSAVPL